MKNDVRNITTQDKIALLEDKLHACSTIFNQVDVGIIKGYLDETRPVAFINERALQMIGYTREQYQKELDSFLLSRTLLDDIPSMAGKY